MTLRALLLCSLLLPLPAFAQSGASLPDADEDTANQTITVTAIRGSLANEFPPVQALDEAAIASYGAGSLTELVQALGNQTGSQRGRGGIGQPVVLINGRRVSGFAELRDIPPESIVRTEILPEEAAQKFGFPATQRVINFILKENFASRTIELDYGGPSAGGRSEAQIEAGWLKISKAGRTNFSAQYDRDSRLTEAERDIVSTAPNVAAFRTLLPRSETLALNGTVQRGINEKTNATLTLRSSFGDSLSLLGLPQSGGQLALERDAKDQSFGVGTVVDGLMGRWNWTVTGNYDRARASSRTDRSLNGRAGGRDSTRSVFDFASANVSINGPIFRMPAGNATLSLRAGYGAQRFVSRSTRLAGTSQADLFRGDVNARAAIEVPITRSDEGLGNSIGEIKINVSLSRNDLTDFGALYGYGYGFTWEPVSGLSISGSATNTDAAPSPQQLGNPFTLTPNATIYDYARGSTVSASLINGGNPNLRAEQQRDRSLTLFYTVPKIKDLSLTASYTRKRSRDLLASFPALTFDTERAFPSRFVRDANGQLVSLDLTPINFEAAREDSLRFGFFFAKQFGVQPGQRVGGRPGGFGGGGMGGARPGGGRPGMGGGGRGGGPGMFGGPGQGGRWFLAAYDTITLNDDILFATGVARLDRLNGGATGATGGTARHSVDLEGGWFNKGVGVRATANWKSATRVAGGLAASDLYFSDLAVINLRMFFNLGMRPEMVKRHPFLRGSRVALRINNLFDSIQTVRDGTGIVPLRYQPGYLDALGRTIELSFRKIF